ncbi:MAG: hypothetical protein V9G11_05235 [Bifidobacterium adolescentis]
MKNAHPSGSSMVACLVNWPKRLALLDVIRQYPKEVLTSAGLKRFAASEPPYMKGHSGPSFPSIHQSQPRSYFHV